MNSGGRISGVVFLVAFAATASANAAMGLALGDGEPYLIELNHESPEEREWLVRFLDPGGGGISINDEWIVTQLGDKQ